MSVNETRLPFGPFATRLQFNLPPVVSGDLHTPAQPVSRVPSDQWSDVQDFFVASGHAIVPGVDGETVWLSGEDCTAIVAELADSMVAGEPKTFKEVINPFVQTAASRDVYPTTVAVDEGTGQWTLDGWPIHLAHEQILVDRSD